MYALSPKISFLAIVGIYLIACALVGLCGRNRTLGFWGFFAVSFVLSPFFTFLLLLLTQPRDRLRRLPRA